MIKIYSTPSSFLAHHLKNLLETYGIRATVKGENRAIALGDIPFSECWSEIWIFDNEASIRAIKIIKDALDAGVPEGDPWICIKCGEENEAQFTECWKCGAGKSPDHVYV
ncbi:MAG: DUF2007 domain-containing protein [Bacteroidetes bacterium]|nr:DUF2007 domain-containing protein [Bacteroidota bacterium]